MPVRNLLGKEGDGFKYAMRGLDGGPFVLATPSHTLPQGAPWASTALLAGPRIGEHAFDRGCAVTWFWLLFVTGRISIGECARGVQQVLTGGGPVAEAGLSLDVSNH